MNELTIPNDVIKSLLNATRSIWRKPGTITYHDWIIFKEGWAYVSNGYFFYRQAVDFNDSFLLSAPQVFAILKNDDVFVRYTEHQVGIKTGKVKLESKYPFIVKEQLKNFYIPQDTETLPIDGEKFRQVFDHCSRTTIANKVIASNIYVHDNWMISTDSYRITAIPFEMKDTQINVALSELLFDNPDRYQEDEYCLTFYVKNAIISCLKNIGDVSLVRNSIPQKMPSQIITITDPEDAIDALKTLKRFDGEFARKDLETDVTVANGKFSIEFYGNKHKFSQSTECEHTVDTILVANPKYLENAISLNSQIFFEQGLNYIVSSIPEHGGVVYTLLASEAK